MNPARPWAALLLLLASASSLPPVATAAQPPAVIDAGGYLLAYTPAPGWEVKSNANSGSVIVQLIERESGRVAHLAEYRVLKISVPADQRSLSRDEAAKLGVAPPAVVAVTARNSGGTQGIAIRNTAGGSVATCAPSFAASITWIGWRMEATSTSVVSAS